VVTGNLHYRPATEIQENRCSFYVRRKLYLAAVPFFSLKMRRFLSSIRTYLVTDPCVQASPSAKSTGRGPGGDAQQPRQYAPGGHQHHSEWGLCPDKYLRQFRRRGSQLHYQCHVHAQCGRHSEWGAYDQRRCARQPASSDSRRRGARLLNRYFQHGANHIGRNISSLLFEARTRRRVRPISCADVRRGSARSLLRYRVLMVTFFRASVALFSYESCPCSAMWQ
jgi:hypothetical protein